MNKLKNSKIILVLSLLLLFLVIGSASAVDETGNETISTPENNGVDTLSQSMDSVDDGVSAAEHTSNLGANDTNKSLLSIELENNNDNNILSVDNDNEILEEDYTPHTFTELFQELKQTGEITLKYNYYKATGSEGKVGSGDGVGYISASVVDGNGATLDGSNQCRILKIGNSNVQLKNINFINGYYYGGNKNANTFWGGSAVYFSDGVKNITFINCNFTNMRTLNNNNNYGGAIRFKDSSDITFTNCNFESCTTRDMGAAILFAGTMKDVTIYNCKFTNMKSSSGNGGSLYFGDSPSNILISNCVFINSSSYIHGGSIDFESLHNPHNITIIYCNFINSSSGRSGGAINFHTRQIYDVHVKYCNFTKCTCDYNGGAIEYYAYDSSIEDCIFTNCSTSGKYDASPTGYGGAVVLYAGSNNVNISRCIFYNNSASNSNPTKSVGGAIASANADCLYTNISDCIFIENSAASGGALFFQSSHTAVINCNFSNNTARGEGGSIFANAFNCTIRNSDFMNNTAEEGGAVKFNAQNGYMGFCTYINNTATVDGGALCSQATGSTVEVCEFINNTAPVGKDFYGHKIPITFIGMTFTSLWLTNIDYKDPDLTGSPLVNYGYGTDASTPAIWDENALSFLKKNVHCTIYLVDHINNVDIINNLTQEVLNISDLEIVGYDPVWNKNSDGVVDLSGWNHRAFTVNASDVKFTNLTFKNANISGNGGALRIINDAAVIENCTFMNNTACNGSAISFEKGVVLIIENSTFINNTALGNGTVYMYDDANSTMTLNSTFMDNTAYLGSAIYYAGPVWYYADGLTLTNLIKANDTNKDLYDDILPYWENNTKIFTGFNESYWYRAKRCVMDVYVNLAGYSGVHNGTRDDPTDIGMAFQMVAPTGTIHFVNSSEIWNMTKLYNKNEEINYKFGITFEGNNTTSTDYKFINTVYGYDVTMSDFHIINTDTCIEWKARNGRIINSSFTSKDHVALNITGNDLTICDSSFTDNGNGALYVDASGLVLSNCTFNNNNISSGVGSHIVLTENANNTRIIDSRFIKGNNTGIWVNATGVSISGSNFTDNTGINGGALILSNGTLVLSNNNFTRNIVSGNGGALFLSNGKLSMSGNNFTYNKATNDGGAVYLENGTLKEALNNDFWHNRASNNGGALYTNIPVVMDGGVFFNNTADVCGGGIYLNNTNNTLSNMEFNNNTAVNGSAIYVTKNNTLNVNNIVLKGNTHTDFSNIDTTANYGSIYLNNYLSEGLFKDSNLDLGDLQDIWDGTYRLPVIYVNNTGTSRTGGASPETATSLDNALDHLIDGGKIIFTTDYTLEDMVNLTNRTLTLTSNNSSSIIRKDSTGKYLFINLK